MKLPFISKRVHTDEGKMGGFTAHFCLGPITDEFSHGYEEPRDEYLNLIHYDVWSSRPLS